MKNTFYFLLLPFLTISCDKKETKPNAAVAEVATVERGKAIFNENNCGSCHQPNEKVIGPSLQETAKIYKEQKGNMVAFLKDEAPPIVDETLYETMKINLQLTKMMSDEELQSVEMYILSHSK